MIAQVSRQYHCLLVFIAMSVRVLNVNREMLTVLQRHTRI